MNGSNRVDCMTVSWSLDRRVAARQAGGGTHAVSVRSIPIVISSTGSAPPSRDYTWPVNAFRHFNVVIFKGR